MAAGGLRLVYSRVNGLWLCNLLPQAARCRTMEESDAREMARRLAREEGILAGTSTGLNVAAAVQLASELGPEATVVTVAADSGLKYLAGDLYSG